MAGRRLTGRGGGGRRSGPPSPPPPRSPPQLEDQRGNPPPPRSRGDAPPLPEGTATPGGGGCGWTCTLRAQAPPAACSRPTPARRSSADQTWGRRTAAHQNSMGAAPPMTPPITIAHSGRAEGGSGQNGPPGERSTGRPSSPPPPTCSLAKGRDIRRAARACSSATSTPVAGITGAPGLRGFWAVSIPGSLGFKTESAQGPSLPPPEGAPRGRTVLCCEGQAPSPVVHPGHPASPALSLPRVRAPAAPPYPPRVLVAVPMCEGTSSGLRLDAGDAACGGP